MDKKRQNRIKWWLPGSCLAVALAAVFCLVLFRPIPVAPQPGEETVATESVNLAELATSLLSLKEDVKAILQDIENNDLEQAEAGITRVSVRIRAMNTLVSETRGLLGILGGQLENIQNLLDLAQMGLDKLLKPLVTQLREYPISQMKTEEGINTRWIGSYLDFAEAIMPQVQAFLDLANTTDFQMIDKEGKLASYLALANGLMEQYREYEAVLPMLRSLLGVEEDRLYLIAAQNSAEIRASGGFPGSMGTIRITDGVLVLEDFRSVYDVLATYTPEKANITAKENKLFHNGLEAPRDADYCPDFERVAYIWSLGYEKKQKEPIDGVISMTPCIVQRILDVMDEEITLFDGTLLNGDNATKVLQHDIYFEYFSKQGVKDNTEISDQLFADAAKKLMQLVTENLEPERMMAFLSVAEESIADRTLMMWMKDEQQQAQITGMGWNGGLNRNPEEPQAGVYYSCTLSSKMGWFLILDTQIGERSKNEDGSYTYPITVTFSNDISKEEIQSAGGYITGGKGGSIIGSAYFFAPAGGTVTGFEASNNKTVKTDVYQDLQLGYLLSFKIKPGQVITVTYYVTTAPGVEAPLTISKTPTVQEYH